MSIDTLTKYSFVNKKESHLFMDNLKLETLVKILLNKDSNYGELLNSARGLSDFFENFSLISTKDSHYESNDSTHTFLNSGVAISPLDAAICTNEHLRTTMYIRGVFEALNDLLIRFERKRLHILYAGCGPYGTLLIPLLHLFDPKDIEVTFLDIHTSSLNSIKNILQSIGLEIFACKYVQEDATKYKLSKDTHLIITETMKAAFWDEPQVAISLNLLPQLSKKGEFIPNRVVVGFEGAHYKQVLKDNILLKEKDGIYLCDVIDLDSSKDMNKDNLVCTKKYTLAQNLNEKMDLQFTTDIYIYKDNILRENECSLNIPRKVVFDEKPIIGDTISFEYEFFNEPKIKCFINCKEDNLKGWIPQRVIYTNDEEKIIWYKMDKKRFTKPFFDDSFSFSKMKKITTWEKIKEKANSIDSIYPSGFIFHTSRCGSTLLSQLLAQFDENIILSEEQLIHEALTIDHNKKVSKEEKIAILKDTIKVLGEKRFEKEKKLFIKFDAWSILEHPLILEAYPDVPWVLLYRDPVEVLVSQKRKRGLFTIPNQLKGKLFDQVSDTIHFNDYYKEIIYKIFETALKYKDLPKGIFIDYKELKSRLVDKIFPHFGLELSNEEIKKIDNRMSFDAKTPRNNFKDDSQEKNNEADDDIKNFCNQYIYDLYKKLGNFTSIEKSLQVGKLNIFHIKLLWERKVFKYEVDKSNEYLLNQLDYFVLDGLNIPIEKAISYLYTKRPDFSEFEEWILCWHNGAISLELVKKINDTVMDFIKNGQQNYPLEIDINDPVFMDEEMKFWEENGYIVLKDAVDKKDCKELENAILDYQGVSRKEPQNWNNAKDGFWLKEFEHPLLEKNKASKKIHKAFEQLWGTGNLLHSTNRISFNTPLYKSINDYGPNKLHWDISLARPVSFDLLGMLYLNDIKEEQGAFQCIPGFHKKLDQWLERLKKEKNPREEILKEKYQKESIKIPAKAGDFIICRQELPHSSSINKCSYPRFVQYIAMYPANRRIASMWK